MKNGAPKMPAAIAALTYWIVAVPLCYILAFPGGLGAVGIWIGLASGLGAAALCLTWRFYRLSRPARWAPPIRCELTPLKTPGV